MRIPKEHSKLPPEKMKDAEYCIVHKRVLVMCRRGSRVRLLFFLPDVQVPAGSPPPPLSNRTRVALLTMLKAVADISPSEMELGAALLALGLLVLATICSYRLRRRGAHERLQQDEPAEELD